MMPAAGESTKVADHHPANAPMIVDMGKKSRKQIKQLREGRGKLMDEINGLLEELRTAGSISANAQPIVVVVKQKQNARSLMWPLG
jgi:hypothetical protein